LDILNLNYRTTMRVSASPKNSEVSNLQKSFVKYFPISLCRGECYKTFYGRNLRIFVIS
jgi:hypothetical protein